MTLINFEEPKLSDKKWIDPILKNSGCIGVDCVFGSIYIWKDVYKAKVCNFDGLLLRMYESDDISYTFPVGNGDIKLAIDEMINDCKNKNKQFKMIGLTKNMIKYLDSIMKDKFNFYETRNAYDYIYNTDDLAYLKGKKYHSKRNHISKFKRLYNFNYEDISTKNIDECKIFIEKWFDEFSEEKRKDIISEKNAIDLSFKHYNELEFKGGIIRVDEKIVALTIGEEINHRVFDIHFEKALSDYVGSYTMINNEFVKRNLLDYQYINREEDLGIEGLRKSKLSYHPSILLEKYTAVLKS